MIFRLLKYDAPQLLSLGVAALTLLMVISIRTNLLTPPAKQLLFSDGQQLIKASHFRTPLYSDSKVISFARRAITSCFSITAETAEEILDGDSSNEFTQCINANFASLAAKTLMRRFPSDDTVNQIANYDSPLEVIVPMQPTIVGRNKPHEPLRWVVSMPFTATLQSVSAEDTFSFWLLLTVVPEENAKNPSNLIITMVAFS